MSDTEQVSPSRPHPHRQLPSSPSPSTTPILPNDVSAPSAASKPRPLSSSRPSKYRRSSLPFTFPPLFSQPANSSSTSLIPAEGKPIPLDDSTAAHRTSALRQLNSNYPAPVSRHQYVKSSGAQSSTYSQPVIVRTYSGPSTSHAHSYHYRASSVSRGGSKRIPLPASSRTGSYLARGAGKPTIAGIGGFGITSFSSSSNNGQVVNNMPPTKAKKSKLPWQWQSAGREQEEPKLPPLEAFSFKSFMADLQAQEGESGGINADLDRIAEICARARYSLSNQYEVHVAPHGSGAGFAGGGSSSNGRRRGHSHGPTLQAVNSDDDENAGRTHRKRRSGGRRKSVAYGTLETIMSSSRSSEEDKTKKKSAAEIAESVRGRAARKNSDNSAGSGSGLCSGSVLESNSGDPNEALGGSTAGKQDHTGKKLGRKKSSSFATALMDSTRHAGQNGPMAPRAPASLVGQPARPQTSTSHLEIRTAPGDVLADNSTRDRLPESPQSAEHLEAVTELLPHAGEPSSQNDGRQAGWGTWIPWRTTASGVYDPPTGHRRRNTPSHAERNLRQLLMNVDIKDKGKAVSRAG